MIEILPPAEISPRLMYGVRVGDVWVQVEPTGNTNLDGKPQWRWCVDGTWPERVGEGADLHGWGDHREMLSSLLSFLVACAEGRRYAERTGGMGYHGTDGNGGLFPEPIGEWAESVSDELEMLQLELDGGES